MSWRHLLLLLIVILLFYYALLIFGFVAVGCRLLTRSIETSFWPDSVLGRISGNVEYLLII